MFKFLKEQKLDNNKIVKSSEKIASGLKSIFNSKKMDNETLEELENLLISADISVYVVADIIKYLADNKYDK